MFTTLCCGHVKRMFVNLFRSPAEKGSRHRTGSNIAVNFVHMQNM